MKTINNGKGEQNMSKLPRLKRFLFQNKDASVLNINRKKQKFWSKEEKQWKKELILINYFQGCLGKAIHLRKINCKTEIM